MLGMTRWVFAFTAVLLTCASVATATELRFNRYYSDGMVLQQGQPILVRGMGDAGDTVTVSFADKSKSVVAGENGAWSVTLDAVPANANGGELTATSKASGKTVKLSNVLVGDVFMFARQTSINVMLGRDEAGLKVAREHGKTPLLRVISINTIPADKPQTDLAAGATHGWQTVSPKIAAKMSAAAYYFARSLSAKVDVPVGVIDFNMGSHFPISWLSREALLETEKFYGRSDVPGTIKRLERLQEAKLKGEPKPHKEVIGSDPLDYPTYPAAGYNSVIAPLAGLPMKGLILQLGGNYPYVQYAELKQIGRNLDRVELNRAYVETYDIRKNGHRMDPVTTPRVPREWRKAFGNDDLPMAMIMPPGSALGTLANHAIEMRELQRKMALENDALDLILPPTQPVPFSVQPKDEAAMGKRCVNWALGVVYGKDVAATGPVYDRIETSYNTATVHFKPGTANGLRANGELTGFEVAGVEGDYIPATATIDGNVVRVTSDTVRRVRRVRFNWTQYPGEQLVNAAGLPAIPFRSEDAAYKWFHIHAEDDLPSEYFTSAKDWKGGDVTLVNGQLKTHGYPNFAGWVGPVGIKVGPFGPNMGVREVLKGSPAEGKLFVGDVIFAANGNPLGEKAWVVMGQAVTESETKAKEGKLVLGVRRDGKNVDVELTLEVMGSYSPTAPFDCPKTEKIVTQLEEWVAARGAREGFLGSDTLFLLASGNPKYQGLARRAIYNKISRIDLKERIDGTRGPKTWFLAWDALLLGEYYHATGDRNVLPYLEYKCAWLAAKQHPLGGYRHNFPGGDTYGLLPAVGVPGTMGYVLAKEAGVEVSPVAMSRGLSYFHDGQAEMGRIIYGIKVSSDKPPVIDPAHLAEGKMQTFNGAVASAALLYDWVGDTRTAHLCSFISSYSWNTTFEGHGGNFWNNFWTPLGAHAHGREAFIHFWKGHRWYREMNRMFDGSLIINESRGVGAGQGVALVSPRERLRITGAPNSPFAVNAPEALKPAVAAYFARDYAKAEKLVSELLASGTVGKNDRPTVEKLHAEAVRMQESIEHDLTKLEALVKEGRFHEAKLDIPQLKGVLPEGHQRLAAIEKTMKEGKPRADDSKLYTAALRQHVDATSKTTVPAASKERVWKCVVTEISTDPRGRDKSPGKVPAEKANKWQLKVVEARSQSPAGWTQPGFDDAGWDTTNLPISWHLNHTALLRTTFTLDDVSSIKAMRFRAWLFRQQDIEIHLNGQLIGRVNNLEKKTGNVESMFNESAVKLLKKGENTLAIATRQNWRWGMLFMRVYNDGFGFRLDVSEK